VPAVPESVLLEIGVEELPARFCVLGLEQIAARGEALLREARLGFTRSGALGTPRRLAWLVEHVAERQEDAATEVRGPARASAYDTEGRPTAAARGFARAQGLDPADLVLGTVGGREYVFARRLDPGRPAAEVLAALLPRLIASLEFPRTMRWGGADFRFPRPIRWVVALLGPDVVPCTVAGLQAGRTTFGHRALHPGPLQIGRPEAYVEALRGAGVLVEPTERQKRIRAGVHEAVSAVGGRPRVNEDLLEEVTHLCEFPTPFVGRFDPGALAVPDAVLVTVMRVHQRYFPVEDADGRLQPQFVGVRDGGTAGLAAVAAGNEKVLAARFADARFFYEDDCREPLAARLSRLDTVAFAEGLGSLADKTERVARLGAALAGPAGAAAEIVERAARLSKADRLTHVVYELPELEGTMGGHYAARDGEPAAVAAAIGQHVLPRAAGDALPESVEGRVLAVADRLDSLAGHFLRGRVPTGSADPLGLRRAGSATVRILEEAGWDLDLGETVRAAARGYPAGTGDAAAVGALEEFLQGRLRARLEEAGFRHDVVDAVLAAGAGSVAGAVSRCRALQDAVEAPGWEDVITAWRRAANIARGAEPAGAVPAAPGGLPAERALAEALDVARGRAERAQAARDHAGVLEAVGTLRPAVDAMLEAVLVMDPDPGIRARRLGLLRGVAALPRPVADLGRLSG
jgi:glycyl-tRNA synthetase beta chain